MNSISVPTTYLTDTNCGSMTELMLQVWLLVSSAEVASVTPYQSNRLFNNEIYFGAATELTDLNYGSMTELILQVWLLISILEVNSVTLHDLTVFNNELYFEAYRRNERR